MNRGTTIAAGGPFKAGGETVQDRLAVVTKQPNKREGIKLEDLRRV